MSGRKPDEDFSEEELHQVEERIAVGAHVLHEAIRREGEAELERPAAALAWSGLAAGISMGTSLLAEGLLEQRLPETNGWALVSKLGYAVGFLVVILGRQQLYTENSLTPILPLMANPSWKKVRQVLRLWGIVLATNLVGAFAFGWALARAGIVSASTHRWLVDIASHSVPPDLVGGFVKAIVAGWLVALMLWMLPSSQGNRPFIIVLLAWLIAIGGFYHTVAGSVDVSYLICRGVLPVGEALWRFLLPVTIGNTLGGVSLVAALNHGQVVAGQET